MGFCSFKKGDFPVFGLLKFSWNFGDGLIFIKITSLLFVIHFWYDTEKFLNFKFLKSDGCIMRSWSSRFFYINNLMQVVIWDANNTSKIIAIGDQLNRQRLTIIDLYNAGLLSISTALDFTYAAVQFTSSTLEFISTTIFNAWLFIASGRLLNSSAWL